MVATTGKIILSTLRDSSPSDKDLSPSSISENKPEEVKSDLITVESDGGTEQIEQPWWELDPESGKYKEKGPNLSGFKLKLKMRVKVRDDHLHQRHVSSGNANIKCQVKLENVRESLGIKHGSVDQPVRMETHTPDTHPLICPFVCSETNIPCEVSFQNIDQKYYVDHVIMGKCPYSKGKNLEEFLPSRLLTCDLCNEEVVEKEAQQHLDQKHFKISCPACKGRYQDRIDVEDHIINDHATHFMSQLSSIYRNKKNQRTMKQPEPVPEPEEVKEPEVSEYTTLEDLIREKKEYDAMIKKQAQYLAGLKGTDQTNGVNRFLLNLPSPAPAQPGQVRPQLVVRPPQPPPGSMRPPSISRMERPQMLNPPTSRMAEPRGLRMKGATAEGLQQVRLQNGDLVWAVAKEIVPGGSGPQKKILFQVLCPVVPGVPPPVLVKNPPPRKRSGLIKLDSHLQPSPAPRVARPPRPLAPLAPLAPRVPRPPRAPLTALRPQGRGRAVNSGTLVPRQSVLRPAYRRPTPPLPTQYKVPTLENLNTNRKLVGTKPPELPLPPPYNGSSSSYVNRVDTNNCSDHSYPQSRNEMDDEIEEIDPHDPLALDEGVDPLALDPYEDVDKEITIVS